MNEQEMDDEMEGGWGTWPWIWCGRKIRRGSEQLRNEYKRLSMEEVRVLAYSLDYAPKSIVSTCLANGRLHQKRRTQGAQNDNTFDTLWLV